MAAAPDDDPPAVADDDLALVFYTRARRACRRA
jgi:hypothetical protein